MRRTWNGIVAGLMLLSLPLRVARSQRDSARVRVLVAESVDRDGNRWGPFKTVTGVVASFANDTLRLTIGGQAGSMAIPVWRIAGIYESDGFHHHVIKGAFVGYLGGVAAGMVTGLTANAPSCPASALVCNPPNGDMRFLGSLLVAERFGAIGIVLGALAGAIPHEHWRTSSSPRVDALLGPGANGARVGLTLHW